VAVIIGPFGDRKTCCQSVGKTNIALELRPKTETVLGAYTFLWCSILGTTARVTIFNDKHIPLLQLIESLTRLSGPVKGSIHIYSVPLLSQTFLFVSN
jgi:hypothetical protein